MGPSQRRPGKNKRREVENKRMTYITPILSGERAGGSGEPLPACLWYK